MDSLDKKMMTSSWFVKDIGKYSMDCRERGSGNDTALAKNLVERARENLPRLKVFRQKLWSGHQLACFSW